MRRLFTIVCLFFCAEVCDAYPVEKERVIVVRSLEKLVYYAGKDGVKVKMKPGTYDLKSGWETSDVALTSTSQSGKSKPYPVKAILHFSGNDSEYDLSGAVINIHTDLIRSLGNSKVYEVFVTGSNNTITGLTTRDIGKEIPVSSAIMMQVMGDDNTIIKADLFIQGSTPYGYGHLLGKGGRQIYKAHKHSSLLVTGKNTKLLGCKVVTRAFGHGIVMQGAVNTLIENCYVEGEMRTTNEMLAETSGPAFETGFKSDYPPGKILPNEIKALAEDGVRSYPYGPLVGRKTENITVINTTVKNMRSGFDLSASLSPTIVRNCTAIGCQEKGYSIGNGGEIINSVGDAMYGPILTFVGNDITNCTVDLYLKDTISDYPPTRLAEINGAGHSIRLRNYQHSRKTVKTPIVFGESFWGDVHIYRNPEKDYSDFAGARNVTLINETGMPVLQNEFTRDCVVKQNDDSYKIEVTNAGVGGNTTKDLLNRIEIDVINQNPDMVILMVGTNDMLNSKKMLSYEEYETNLRELTKKIKSTGSDLLIMSSIPADSIYLFERHDPKLFVPDGPNVKIQKTVAIAKNISEETESYFLDLNAVFVARNIPQHNQDLFIKNFSNSSKKDGVHPTALGYHLIATHVFQFLKEKGLTDKYMKIVCFGDSITKGGGSEINRSLAKGNYPSYLQQLLNK